MANDENMGWAQMLLDEIGKRHDETRETIQQTEGRLTTLISQNAKVQQDYAKYNEREHSYIKGAILIVGIALLLILFSDPDYRGVLDIVTRLGG